MNTENRQRQSTKPKQELIAVLDTETNWDNKVMSIGVVLADSLTFQHVRSAYYIFMYEAQAGGMYSNALRLHNTKITKECSREKAMAEIVYVLKRLNVRKVFAYNASFDKNQLPELHDFDWYDIMRIAAYRQYNRKIPNNAECHQTGRLKRNFGVEPITRLLSGDNRYCETHNAYQDAIDELRIMELLGHDISIYEHARLA